MMKLRIFVVVILVVTATVSAETVASTTSQNKESKKRDAPVAVEKSAFDYTAPSQSGFDASGYENSGSGYESYSGGVAAPQVSLPSGSYGTPLAPPLNEHTYSAGGHSGVPEFAALQGSNEMHGNDLNSYGSPHGSVGAVSVAALTGGNHGLSGSYGAPMFIDESAGSHGGSPASGTYQTIGFEIADHSLLGGSSIESHGGPPVIALGGHSGSFGAGHGNNGYSSGGISSSYGAPASKPWQSSGGKGGWQQNTYNTLPTQATSKPWASQSSGSTYGTMSQGWIKLNGGGNSNSAPKGWSQQGRGGNGPKSSFPQSSSFGSPVPSNSYGALIPSNSYGAPVSSSSYSSPSYGAPTTVSAHQITYSSPNIGSFGGKQQRPDFSVPSYAQGQKGLKHYSSPSNSISFESYGGGNSNAGGHSGFGGHGLSAGLGGGQGFGGHSNGIGHSSGFGGHSSGFGGQTNSLGSGYTSGYAGHSSGGGGHSSGLGGGHSSSGFGGHSSGFGGHSDGGGHSSGFSGHSSGFGGSNIGNSGYSYVGGFQGHSPSFGGSFGHGNVAQSYNSGPQKYNKNVKQVPLNFNSKPIASFTSFAGGSKTPFKPSAFLGAIGGDDVTSGYEYSASPKQIAPQKSYLPPSSNYGAPASSSFHSSSYPSSNYGSPSSSYGVPSSSYGAPSGISSSYSGGGFESHGYEK